MIIFFVEHWWGGTWTNPDRFDTDKRYLSQLGPLTRRERRRSGRAVLSSTLTWLGVKVQWESPEPASGFSSCVKLLLGRVIWVQSSFEEINATHVGLGHMSTVQLFPPFLYKYPHCGTATGWSICLNTQPHISQLFLPASWALTILNNSSGRSDSVLKRY